jgi:hypothetical protein
MRTVTFKKDISPAPAPVDRGRKTIRENQTVRETFQGFANPTGQRPLLAAVSNEPGRRRWCGHDDRAGVDDLALQHLLGHRQQRTQGNCGGTGDAVDKDEFAELFKSCALVMARTHRDEKLHAAANILVNLLLKAGDPAKVSYDELDHLIRCVDALSTGAISVLGAIRQVSVTRPLGPQQEAFQFGQLREKLQMDASLLRSLVSELEGLHLVRVQETPIRGYAEAEYDGSHLDISPIGKRLIERFIEGTM